MLFLSKRVAHRERVSKRLSQEQTALKCIAAVPEADSDKPPAAAYPLHLVREHNLSWLQ